MWPAVTLLAAISARLGAALALRGYVHPDEFFQAPEVVYGDVLGLHVDRPWEFESGAASARSVLPPYLVTGPPLMLLRVLAPGWLHASPHASLALLSLPRLGAFAWSLVVDTCVLRLSAPGDRGLAVMLASTSYVAWVFAVRPLSNSLEGVWVMLCLLTLHAPGASPSTTARRLGAIVALGLFTRVTFAVFALPLGVCFVWNVLTETAPAKSPVRRVLTSIVVGAAATLGSGAVLAAVDSLYFGTLRLVTPARGPVALIDVLALPLGDLLQLRPEGTLTLTPLNNLLYNIDPDNLALHTLHPRWLHAVVNMPMLFGPLAVAGALLLAAAVRRWAASPRLPVWRPFTVAQTAAACCVVPLAVLSLVPHQEPRFLVPLLGPLVLAVAGALRANGRALRVFVPLWLVFNLGAGAIYGGLHQGGVAPAMDVIYRDLCASAPHDVHVVFAHTYMPPDHLLPRANGTLAPLCWGRAGRVQLSDLKGASPDRLAAFLTEQQQRANPDASLVLASSGVSQLASQLAQRGLHLHRRAGIGPHLCLEHAAGYLARPLEPATWQVQLHDVREPAHW